MPTRLRLIDCRLSQLPAAIGLCQGDIPGIRDAVNQAQRRLLFCKEAGEEGFFGTFSEVVFNVSKTTPYLTLPREIARLELTTVCNSPVQIQNQFYEYLQFGNGTLPRTAGDHCGDALQVYSRNNAVTFTDLTNAPQLIRIYSNSLDAGKRVLIQGTNSVGDTIYSQDALNRASGVFVPLEAPFVTMSVPSSVVPMPVGSITGIQKDMTSNPVSIYQVDPSTGAEVLLLTMEPGEKTAWYRRYYLDSSHLCSCPCGNVAGTVQVKSIAKMDLIPVVSDTDYLLFQNLEAIIEECKSARYSTMDKPDAKQMAQEAHLQAVRLLNGELSHYLGLDTQAVRVSPFGNARLRYQKIGSLV